MVKCINKYSERVHCVFEIVLRPEKKKGMINFQSNEMILELHYYYSTYKYYYYHITINIIMIFLLDYNIVQCYCLSILLTTTSLLFLMMLKMMNYEEEEDPPLVFRSSVRFFCSADNSTMARHSLFAAKCKFPVYIKPAMVAFAAA